MKEMPLCGEEKTHPATIRKEREPIPSEETLLALADFYKVFGDSTRLRILSALKETELCVCEIAGMLGMTVSAISHQLRILKQAKLVRSRKDGKTVFYALADAHIHEILGMGLAHIRE